MMRSLATFDEFGLDPNVEKFLRDQSDGWNDAQKTFFECLIYENGFTVSQARKVVNLPVVENDTIKDLGHCAREGCDKEEMIYHTQAFNSLFEYYSQNGRSDYPKEQAYFDLDAMHDVGAVIKAECDFLGCTKQHDKVAQTMLLSRLTSWMRKQEGGYVLGRNKEVDAVIRAVSDMHKEQ
ncbi:MAG: hypothetical protein FWE45_00170 [Firmicutes bacterium]|nr:hypothetical protein [Bacillota bacterium]